LGDCCDDPIVGGVFRIGGRARRENGAASGNRTDDGGVAIASPTSSEFALAVTHAGDSDSTGRDLQQRPRCAVRLRNEGRGTSPQLVDD
jgi:hypothetical protein